MNVVHDDRRVPRFLVTTMGLTDLGRRIRAAFRGEDIFALFPLALLWIALLGILPMVAAMIVGMAQGTISEDVSTASPGYPALPVLSTGMVAPAAALAFLFVRTFTWPLKSLAGVRRSEIALLSFVGLGALVTSSSLEMDHLPDWAAKINAMAMMLFFATLVLAFARSAAGMRRLVPRSWREEPTRPKRKRTS
jgi:hypothetical protein